MEFERIDDFSRYLNLNDGEAIGRAFQHLVNRHFDYIENHDGTFTDAKDDLILCFLEMVSLDDEDAIGDTLLRSHYQNNRVKTFIKEYQSIIEKVKKDPCCIPAISGYEQWYSMGTYILQVSNPEILYTEFQTDSSWDGQPPETIKDPKKPRETYATHKGELTESDIKKYLNFYYQELKNNLGFNKYPNTCIIVKPISVSDGENPHIPLGNLYLHFATKSPKSLSFYLRFINDFMRVWFVVNGHDMITKIKNFAVSEFIDNHHIDIKDYLPVFEKSKKARLTNQELFNNGTFASYFDKLYQNVEEQKQFENMLIVNAKKVIEQFIQIKNQPKGTTSWQPYVEIRKTFDMTPASFFRREYSFEKFTHFLYYREIFKIGVLLFDLDPMNLHYSLTSNSEKDHKATNRTLYTALWSERLIPSCGGENYNPRAIKNKVLSCCCSVEKKYLEEYRKIKTELERQSTQS